VLICWIIFCRIIVTYFGDGGEIVIISIASVSVPYVSKHETVRANKTFLRLFIWCNVLRNWIGYFVDIVFWGFFCFLRTFRAVFRIFAHLVIWVCGCVSRFVFVIERFLSDSREVVVTMIEILTWDELLAPHWRRREEEYLIFNFMERGCLVGARNSIDRV